MNILDLLQRGVTGFNGLFAPTQGIGMPPTIPGNDLPSQGGIAGNIPPAQKPGFPGMPPMGFPMGGASAMDSPAMQIGLRMLMNSSRQPGPRRGLGDIVGSSVLGYQQDSREQQMQKLQAQMLQARLKKEMEPAVQDKGRLVMITCADGKPTYAYEADAAGKQPFIDGRGESNGPGELAIAQALNDPNTPEAVKKDLRNLLARKYPGPQAQEPLVAIQTTDGRSVYVPRSQAAGATPAAPRENFVPTEGERTSANYFTRMDEAEKKLGDYRPSVMDYVAAGKMMSGGGVTSSIANSMVSGPGQAYYQAAADWVRAKLRKESGAVISPEEMAQEIKTYFPMPGDSEGVIEQKKQAREIAKSGMAGMGGRAISTSSAAPNNDPLGIR